MASLTGLLVLFLLATGSKAALVRTNVATLSPEDIQSLQEVLHDVVQDTSEMGYGAIASYHGYPALCTDQDQPVACCIHGNPMFPQWHRLYVVHFERAMKAKGLEIGIPYWDWTTPLTQLPGLVTQYTFNDSRTGVNRLNSWLHGHIDLPDGSFRQTARALDDRLFQEVSPGEHTSLFEHVLSALEYHDYCQFEVQFEVAHNTIHYLVGGRNKYSMSTLEYTAYDPIFFLHHSNVDRIFQVYLDIVASYGYTFANCTGSCSLCDVNGLQTPMEPFEWKTNPITLTRHRSLPHTTLDTSQLGYNYDDVTLNGYNVEELKAMMRERQGHDRAFAAFRLSNIGSSANVRVEVCLDSGSYCEFAGDFFVLGGPSEMSWTFHHPYYLEVTKAVQKLGVALDGVYSVKARVFSVDGEELPSDVIPPPYVHFRPASGKSDPKLVLGRRHDEREGLVVRTSVDRLTKEEEHQLRHALQRFQNDKSVDGYQATAEFHGAPGKCPFPSASVRQACCVHGMPTFPHWHRLFVVQIENALKRRGSHVGVPYWDWTKPGTIVPALASARTYKNPIRAKKTPNPFYNAHIEFLGDRAVTRRDVSTELTQTPELGDHTELFDAFLLALEQDNFCDFEIQFEISHNLVHALLGGPSKHSMSTLAYSAFDPIFYLHHSNVDRIWAIWTALQQLRGKPYKAHCAQSYVQTPLKPFAFSSPLNNDEVTYSHSVPTNIYDYERELHYTYDSLEFGGMSVEELENYINVHRKGKERMFAGIMLHGIKETAMGHVFAHFLHHEGTKYEVGRFAILGGPLEMDWSFDREFRLDITDKLEELGVTPGQKVFLTLALRCMQGHLLNSSFPKPRLIHEMKQDIKASHERPLKLRKNINTLTREEAYLLRMSLSKLQEDDSVGGYQTIASFHGTPKWCPHPEAKEKVACCLHGMPVFPHWHRLIAVQMENALRTHGWSSGLPYWDWTVAISSFPVVLAEPVYISPCTLGETKNPCYSSMIAGADNETSRSPSHSLFESAPFGGFTEKAKQVLLALEQDDFCDFEVQFEIAHNFLHAQIGGDRKYSMANLEYAAFDPIFYLHHSNTDRIWAIWQALQKYRGKPYNSANCAVGQFRRVLQPFGFPSDINPDHQTREHARAFRAFDYRNNFEYEYDELEFNGLTIPQLHRVLEDIKGHDRVFLGFMLRGIQASAIVRFKICIPVGFFVHNPDLSLDPGCPRRNEEFFLLGSPHEMPWAYDRLYKYEITEVLARQAIEHTDQFYVSWEVADLDGNILGRPFPEPSVIHDVGIHHQAVYTEHMLNTGTDIRKDLSTLTEGETESLRAAFLAIERDHTYEDIAAFHGKPGLCEHEGRKVACCVHGMATFPAWHRLYVEQVEEAVLAHGSSIALPYWDWTAPISHLPSLVGDATYFNSRTRKIEPNPFFKGRVKGEGVYTTRDPQPQLFHNDYFHEATLLALEQTHFCDFEIQFEIVHNALHSWLGGRAKYSMSSLDYTAFDPVFFLHHTNTDRIWAIWQELQRFRGLPYNEADCAINLMSTPLMPFGDDSHNHGDTTHRYSRPADTFDYRNHFGYEYDNLEFNGMSIPQLENLLHQRQETGRVFAGFLLHNIGLSADVEIYVCVPSEVSDVKDCSHKAGTFSILGGELEMPFTFDRLYRHDITRTVKGLNLRLDNSAAFEVKVYIRSVNGSYLSSELLPPPSVIFLPGTGEKVQADGQSNKYTVRKSVDSLTPQETESLVKALTAVQADSSADGFQAIASFHALPPLCPSPQANKRFACCLHGMATFPQWHRLYTVQLEDALYRHGSLVGIPYWDWTRQFDHLPELLSQDTFMYADSGLEVDNPWTKGHIEFEDTHTERDVDDKLFEPGPHGWDTWFFRQALLALEQEDYCDFEIQLEITHNALHSWLGGSKEHSMGHLHYASYDPAFFLHHSNTDRLWALWQALQEYRGNNPNDVSCALEQMREPMKPFSFGSPYNLNPNTEEYSKPEDTFDYQNHFGYRYDDLEFVGMDIPRLDNYIKEVQSHDRVFAGFLLKGFYTSATVQFCMLDRYGVHHTGGHFTVLGGSAEMPWQFDRLYKYEITDQLASAGLHFDDEFHFQVKVTDYEGNELDSDTIPAPSVIYHPTAGRAHEITLPANKVRQNLNSLSPRDVQSLQLALRDLQEDSGPDGWESLASFHGEPARCTGQDGSKQACCQHGMPTFPHWHRLFTLQVEQALQRHGSAIALPYWDWTLPITKLPSLFTEERFRDAWRDEVIVNPFARGFIPTLQAHTVRDIQEELFLTTNDGNHSAIWGLVLTALEQKDYCNFEVQFEVMHNAIHYLVGGHQTYALSSLEYSAYDPLFFIHHAFTDKIWAVWQQLQKRRHLPSAKADCALNYMSSPMRPFHLEDINANVFTRSHAVPNTVFDYEALGYAYDDLTIGGLDVAGLEKAIDQIHDHPRVFAGFLLKGVKTSGSVVIKVCRTKRSCGYAGRFNLLGGPTEMPWAFDRLFKYDITDAVVKSGLEPEDVFNTDVYFKVKVEVSDVEGQGLHVHDVMPEPTVIYQPAVAKTSRHKTHGVGTRVRKDVSALSSTEVHNLRDALSRVQADEGPNGYQHIASFHGLPAGCDLKGRPVACCQHGMANFPQWHRLFVKQFEDALTAQGSELGIPYWDWTTAFTKLPALVTDKGDNPFHHGITFDGHKTSRSYRDQLFTAPGSESFFYTQALLAFEQTDYCDFEVQFEITHNAIHSWTGGRSPYGMSTLEYTAYDPLFLLHHSNVDRQFAIWQALQKFRGLPYNTANCAIHKLREPMRPFSDEDNVNPTTRANSKANDAFDYDHLNYQYDNLNFHGLSISELNDVLEKRKEEDRIFAEFMLKGFGGSADVTFELCNATDVCVFAGTFATLGGPSEMTWSMDRPFKYDVTDVFAQQGLRLDDKFYFRVGLERVDGTRLDATLIKSPSVVFLPGTRRVKTKAAKVVHHAEKVLRKDIHSLSLAETTNLRKALASLQADKGPNGFEAIAGFHGAPYLCPVGSNQTKIACCAHGMPIFPQWHRLHTLQFEQALRKHGALVGIPYWDWTADVHALPSLIGQTENNPFFKYHISFENACTKRDVQYDLFHPPKMHGYNKLFTLALTALEEDDYCNFVVQYEVLHNEIHRLIGGAANHSMTTLEFSAFDPVFMIHHATIDRIWIVWQFLQKLRRKSPSHAPCAGHYMDMPLAPFHHPDVNTNLFTRRYSDPKKLSDIKLLGYEYDNLRLGGHDVASLHKLLTDLKGKDRLYVGFVINSWLQPTIIISMELINEDGVRFPAGNFTRLEGVRAMLYAHERIFKYDVTDVARRAGITAARPGMLRLRGDLVDRNVFETTIRPNFYERPANANYEIYNIYLSRYLVSKIIVSRTTRIRFHADGDFGADTVEDLGSYSSYVRCNIPPFALHSSPIGQMIQLEPGDHFFVASNQSLCEEGKKIVITVQDE